MSNQFVFDLDGGIENAGSPSANPANLLIISQDSDRISNFSNISKGAGSNSQDQREGLAALATLAGVDTQNQNLSNSGSDVAEPANPAKPANRKSAAGDAGSFPKPVPKPRAESPVSEDEFGDWLAGMQKAGNATNARRLMTDYVGWRNIQERPLNEAYRHWISNEDAGSTTAGDEAGTLFGAPITYGWLLNQLASCDSRLEVLKLQADFKRRYPANEREAGEFSLTVNQKLNELAEKQRQLWQDSR